jgi:glutathione S-transferase
VPLLIDGDLVLCESVAIVLYLAEKYPDRGFIPADLKLRADFYRWILFAVTELEQPWWRIAKHTHLYPEQDRLPAEVALARRDFPVPARRSPRAGRHSLTGPIKRHSHCFTCLPLTRPWAGDW